MMEMRTTNAKKHILLFMRYTVILLLIIAFLIPFCGMIITSFKDSIRTFTISINGWVYFFDFENHAKFLPNTMDEAI